MCLSVCFTLYLLSVTQVCVHWITALRSANFFYCMSVAQAFLILCHLPKFIHVFAPSLSLESDDICGCLPLIIVIQWNGEIAAGMKRGGGGERCVSVRKTSDPECLHMHSVFKSEDDCWGTVGKRIVGAKIPESESLKDSHVVSLCQSQNMQSLKLKCVIKMIVFKQVSLHLYHWSSN